MPSPPGEHCVSFGKSARLSLSLSPLTSVLARRLGIRPPLPSHSEVQGVALWLDRSKPGGKEGFSNAVPRVLALNRSA